MKINPKVFVAGDTNILGAALIRHFKLRADAEVLGDSACGLDLTDQHQVRSFFEKEKPEQVFLTYPQSGGIFANLKYPAQLFYDNLQIQTNLIHSAYKTGVKKLIFLASSCVYPVNARQPLKEGSLFSGSLEESSQMYALAKLAGIEMCQAYRRQYKVNYTSLVPATVYGPGDDFDPERSHVIPALIKKFHDAKIKKTDRVIVAGTGKPRREFIYLDDLVKVCLLLMDKDDFDGLINVGSGQEVTIKQLAELTGRIIGFEGKIIFDHKLPDGAARKFLDNTKLESLGWMPKTFLEEGIRLTYDWYKKH